MLTFFNFSLNLIIILTFINFINATQSTDSSTSSTTTKSSSSASSSSSAPTQPPKLLVVSFDAFCPWYFQRNRTSFMNQLRTENVKVDYMRNVFPTKTFVNHFSIATGLYPETHGVLGNSLYDLKLKKELKYSYELFHYNNDILPIWTLNELAGGSSGCMMWPGSDYPYAKIKNISCTYQMSYDKNIVWNNKVDTVIDWLTKNENPANLVMLYFDEPDYHGHVFSPNSTEVLEMIERVDNITKYIHKRLTATKLIDSINIVYISDHGMDSLTSPNFINLTEMISSIPINTTNININTTEINSSNNYYNIYSSSPVLQIVPTFMNDTMIIYEQLKKQSKLNGHFKVYTNETILPRWHCNNSDRLAPIIVVADINYAFQDMFKQIKYYQNVFNISLTPTHEYGLHGYDNTIETMHSFFFAVGPAFKKQHTIAHPFDSIDLYNLFTILLDIENLTPPNNGTKANIVDALVDYHDSVSSIVVDVSTEKSYLVAAFTVPFLIIGLIVIGLIYLRRRRQSHRGSQYNTLFGNTNFENM